MFFQVNAGRPYLQALQDAVAWTIGGYNTRPTVEAKELKHRDRTSVLLGYRQPPIDDPQNPPPIAMHDYLCHTLFDVPTKPVGPDVARPTFQQDDGSLVQPDWQEVDWDAFRSSGRGRPSPVFRPNRYPYQLPKVHGSVASHYLLWYFHLPEEGVTDPPDDVIQEDVLCELVKLWSANGCKADIEFIWYRNPAMSVPDVFHVQVFWRYCP
eukprot:TRINITY_DN15992_c0_g2_i1.p1 TRINITY_DN15992_c0_g2~~TRINITY_DN15992_c0_g2_i1.p1  ORF type:complete len:210 (+),score=26.63 TRINITY_DN15992_c0_g2_i1:157-786(+)